MAEDEKKEYVVKEGRTFGVDAKPAGTSVFLTDEEAKGFSDLVELRVKPKKAPEAEEPVTAAKGKK